MFKLFIAACLRTYLVLRQAVSWLGPFILYNMYFCSGSRFTFPSFYKFIRLAFKKVQELHGMFLMSVVQTVIERPYGAFVILAPVRTEVDQVRRK